jgi:hypothetical protein
MPCLHSSSLGRRAFVAGGGVLLVGCSREASPPRRGVRSDSSPRATLATADACADALFDAYPALAKALARGRGSGGDERRRPLFRLRRWKVRKLELYFGEARALGKRRIITSGGVGSNQAVAGAALRLFDTVHEGHARALQDALESVDAYVIPLGGTTPLGTLGFVSAGLELAEDIRAGRAPAPRRAHDAEGWDLDPVYTGKALAALLDDRRTDPAGRGLGPLLFWNTTSARPVATADVPVAFRRFAR